MLQSWGSSINLRVPLVTSGIGVSMWIKWWCLGYSLCSHCLFAFFPHPDCYSQCTCLLLTTWSFALLCLRTSAVWNIFLLCQIAVLCFSFWDIKKSPESFRILRKLQKEKSIPCFTSLVITCLPVILSWGVSLFTFIRHLSPVIPTRIGKGTC